jgi:hypothetical protein
VARWWPALASGTIALACAAVFTVQQTEIRSLEETQRLFSSNSAVAPDRVAPTNDGASAGSEPAGTATEIARLRLLADQLSKEVSQLERLRAENEALRQHSTNPAADGLVPREFAGLDEQPADTQAVLCLNNLKQLGLSVRVWAQDNDQASPPRLLDMTNEMSTPKILVCPADTIRQAATDWASFTGHNCSYEYLAPAAPEVETEPSRLLFRCPIHGNIALCDGSVQMSVSKTHPERIYKRDGKLYLREGATTESPASGEAQGVYRRLYGVPGKGPQ